MRRRRQRCDCGTPARLLRRSGSRLIKALLGGLVWSGVRPSGAQLSPEAIDGVRRWHQSLHTGVTPCCPHRLLRLAS